jgi:hypothetical protein
MKSPSTYGAAALVAIALLIAAVPRSQADVNLWPLLELSEDETTVLYPLFVNEPRFQMIFPFYYKANESRDTHLLWPLIKFHDGKLQRAAPFYFRDNENYTFFPVIRQTEAYTMWFIPPMYFDKDGDFSAIVPIYIASQHAKFLFPNTYWHRDSEGEVDNWCFWPIATHDTRDGDDYMRVLNYARSTNADKEWSTFFPLYFKGKSADEEETWMLPYYSFESERQSTRCLFPLFHGSNETFANGQSRRTRNVLWPLYHLEEERDAQGKVTSRDRRFLIFSDTRTQFRRTMRVFGIPISERIQ